MHVTAEQLLREPAGPRSEPPRSLSNAALLASMRPPAYYGSSPAPRRSIEPHLVEGLSWFLDRAPWQRALLSTGLGALIGVGIVVTFVRLFYPELGSATAPATSAQSELTALVAPAAATLLAEPQAIAAAATAPAAAAVLAPAREQPAAPASVDEASDEASAGSVAAVDSTPEAKPAKRKLARKGKAAKRSKKAKQSARKPSSLPARWAELYARDR